MRSVPACPDRPPSIYQMFETTIALVTRRQPRRSPRPAEGRVRANALHQVQAAELSLPSISVTGSTPVIRGVHEAHSAPKNHRGNPGNPTI